VKNGVEIRKNGNMIIKRKDGWWVVKIKQPDGSFKQSENGPWGFIYNARSAADRGL